jgi:uncharacterized protein YkwD
MVRSRKFLIFCLFLVILAVLGLGFRSRTSAAAKANIILVGSLSPQAYLPIIRRDPSPTPTVTPTKTPTATPGASGCPSHYGAFEQQLYVLINDTRADYGLSPLTPNDSLETSAGRHSDDMAVNHFISHTGSDGSTFWQRAVEAGYTGRWGGEIIMYSNSPEAAMEWWMGDAPHRDMILSDTNDFGAGYAKCSGDYAGYFTVDFGHR